MHPADESSPVAILIIPRHTPRQEPNKCVTARKKRAND